MTRLASDAGFVPIATPDARVLVLGSMPGRRSLEEQQYYGHPQNAFWRIMSDLTQVDASMSYPSRVAGLNDAGIAVWDVIESCVRPGSLDADIESDSIRVNDFNQFFRQHPRIQAVFFNGGKAAQEYNRRVLPDLSEPFASYVAVQLLSTSPANARFSLVEKKASWQAVGACLGKFQQD